MATVSELCDLAFQRLQDTIPTASAKDCAVIWGILTDKQQAEDAELEKWRFTALPKEDLRQLRRVVLNYAKAKLAERSAEDDLALLREEK